MKHTARFVIACAALFGLLFGLSAHATDISTKPLKADVLVKPNVIFAWDDSGSMDWDIMLDRTNSGILWWDRTTGTAYDGSGRPHVSTAYYPLSYVFQISGTGGNLFPYNSSIGMTAPPTAQFAPMRSHAFNPLYYNPAVTYRPWPPAYFNSADQTFADSPPTAARSHPAVSGSVTLDLTVNQSTGTMYIQRGMRRPDNTVWNSDSLTTANYTYFPATYWVIDNSCPVDNSDINSSCVSAPDGRRLRRIQITPANYASTADYNAAIQNFANWFTYYRKRKLMAAGSIGKVLDNLSGMRLGVVKFNNPAPATMYDTDAALTSSNGRAVAGIIYSSVANGGTPTRETLSYIGNQYMTNNSIIEYSCQRNNAFVVTDGFANGSSVTPPAYDAARSNSTGWPYQPTAARWLADIALSYHTVNLRNGRANLTDGRVPLGDQTVRNPDSNTNLHMNTYALSLGVRGSVWPMPTGQDPWSNPFTWPAPAIDMPSAIDDLYHATINGRGQMYLATDATGTAQSIHDGLNDMLHNVGAQSSVAVSSVNLRRGDGNAYLGVYNPRGWSGDVTANRADRSTGAISTTPLWTAATQLAAKSWTSRVIATYSGGAGRAFTSANVGTIVNPGGIYGTNAQVIDYLRGDRSNETTVFRRRTSLISAVINARPAVSAEDRVVYAASSEGMLHALDTDTGEELWAYVPGSALSEMGAQTKRVWTFETFLDGSPQLYTVGNRKILIGGRGTAGAGYYALDVTSPRGLSEATLASRVMWEFPSQQGVTTAGVAIGRPVIVHTPTGPVALITQGYNGSNHNGRGRLYMLNALTGALLHTFEANAGTGFDPGLAQVTALVEHSGLTQYVYGGDEQGNVWKFDLTDTATATSGVTRVAQLLDAGDNPQPITSAPALVKIEGRVVVLVGTGRLLGMNDLRFGGSTVQSVYAIKDTGVDLGDARAGLKRMVLGAADGSGERDLRDPSNTPMDWATQRGWYFDMPTGEQVNNDPTVVFGALVFTSNMSAIADCASSSYLYVVDIKSGLNVVAQGDTPGMEFASKKIGDFTVSGVTALGFDGRGDHDLGFAFQRSSSRGPPPPPGMRCQDLTCVPPGSIPLGIDSRKNSWRQIQRQ